MLIRLASGDLVEYPDELGALALTDPFSEDVPDFSLEDLNLILSGGFGVLFHEELTLEQNIEKAHAQYTRLGKLTANNMEKALAQIKYYNENIAPADVGCVDLKLVKEAFGIQSSKPKEEVYTVENMPNPPKKLIGHSDISEQTAQQSDENSGNA